MSAAPARETLPVWQPAYIGLGSNLKDPQAQVRHALASLSQLRATRVILASPLYASKPLNDMVQPDFVNAVAGVLTQLDAHTLLAALRALERAFGRPAERQRWGPRVLDLDLLVYGPLELTEAELTVPHPGIVERNFVLYPLADIAPELFVPGLGRVIELKSRVAADGLRRLPGVVASEP